MLCKLDWWSIYYGGVYILLYHFISKFIKFSIFCITIVKWNYTSLHTILNYYKMILEMKYLLFNLLKVYFKSNSILYQDFSCKLVVDFLNVTQSYKIGL